MRHMKRGRKLNRPSDHRKALLRNLAASLIIHKRIKTTDARAKELRSFVEPLITYAKDGSLHARRQVRKVMPGSYGQRVTDILFQDIAPVYANRPGGYTRIVKLGNRTNDKAPVSLIELVDFTTQVEAAPEPDEAEAKPARKGGRGKKKSAPVEPEDTVDE